MVSLPNNAVYISIVFWLSEINKKDNMQLRDLRYHKYLVVRSDILGR